MPWRGEYSFGIRTIDTQHRRLVEMINHLHRVMEGGEDRAAVQEVLANLADYTKTHFAYEERLLHTHGYPDYDRHRGIHERLVAKVLEHMERFRQGSGDAGALLAFLKDWLNGHILGDDKQYSGYLIERGVR